MKKIIIERSLLCTDVIEVEDVFPPIYLSKYHDADSIVNKAFADAVKAEFGLNNCFVEKSKVSVVDVKSDAERRVEECFTWLKKHTHNYVEEAVAIAEDNILKMIRDLEAENRQLRSWLSPQQGGSGNGTQE